MIKQKFLIGKDSNLEQLLIQDTSFNLQENSLSLDMDTTQRNFLLSNKTVSNMIVSTIELTWVKQKYRLVIKQDAF